MLKKFSQWLTGKDDDANGGEPELTPQLAAAALLVETALTDGVYADIEERQIMGVIREGFDLGERDAQALLASAESIVESAVGAHQFTIRVKELSEKQRIKVIEGLYRVSFADGEKCPYEDAYVRHVASLLHVEDRDRAMARKAAEHAVAPRSN